MNNVKKFLFCFYFCVFVMDYLGEKKGGKPSGQGVGLLPSKHYYEGGWTNGKKQGEGVLRYESSLAKKRFKGIWKDDKMWDFKWEEI